MKAVKDAIFVLNEPNAPRLNPALADEIGMNESILLLQIEWWIRSSTTEEREGRQWTYQSVRDMQDFFSFWGLSTIQRTIKSLEDKNLILTGNFNKAKYDRTRWFALNYEECAKLKSIRVGGVGTRSSQNETGSSQNGTRSPQNGTTIPETPTETPTENKHTPRASGNLSLDPAFGEAFAAYEKTFGPLNQKELFEFEDIWLDYAIPQAHEYARTVMKRDAKFYNLAFYEKAVRGYAFKHFEKAGGNGNGHPDAAAVG